jgi:hypothetical protein
MESGDMTSQKKNDYLEFALFLILGFLLGIVVKTEASKRITIGHDDYQVSMNQQFYNINQLQTKLREENSKQNQDQTQQPSQDGGQGATEGAETSR